MKVEAAVRAARRAVEAEHLHWSDIDPLECFPAAALLRAGDAFVRRRRRSSRLVDAVLVAIGERVGQFQLCRSL